MKQGKKVTEYNLATIFGYIQKLAFGKELLRVTFVSTNTFKKANHLFNGVDDQSSLVSIKYDSSIAKVTIEENFLFPKQFIAVRNQDGSGKIIDVGDKIKIAANKIVLSKGNLSEHPRCIEIWEIK